MIISSKNEELINVDYKDEKELQEVIAKSPELLERPDKLYTICGANNELCIKSGHLDLLLVSAKGDIIIVETKLAKNPEIRREVVGQIIDYVVSLSKLSYHELDEASKNNRLSDVVNDIDTELDLPPIIDGNLRNSNIDLIIAVDKVDERNENLVEIVHWLSDYTELRIELVEIRKYKDKDRELFSSTYIVKSSEKNESKRISGERNTENAVLLETVSNAWDNKVVDLKTKSSRNASFRQILVPNLPALSHYEFTADSKNRFIYIRFDNEYRTDANLSSRITDVLKKFENTTLTTVSNTSYKIEYQKMGSVHPTSRIYVLVDNLEDIEEIVAVMDEFIKLTKDKILACVVA